MDKHYYKPECEELLLHMQGVLLDSDGDSDTEVIVYDPSDPNHNYNW